MRNNGSEETTDTETDKTDFLFLLNTGIWKKTLVISKSILD